ncbi:MAG: hypothetical protein ACKO34_04755 [Vampirovibrionales bacterium]
MRLLLLSLLLLVSLFQSWCVNPAFGWQQLAKSEVTKEALLHATHWPSTKETHHNLTPSPQADLALHEL